MTELGHFFCGNCCTPFSNGRNLTYEQKPGTSCAKCGFEEWIFEPSFDEELERETEESESKPE